MKKKKQSKLGKRKSYQQFIDEINKKLEEKKEIEELYKRVIILNAKDVLEELKIKERNMEALKKINEKRDEQQF